MNASWKPVLKVGDTCGNYDSKTTEVEGVRLVLLALGWKDGKPLAADEESQSRSSDYKDTEDDPGDDSGDDPDGDPTGGAGPSTSTTRLLVVTPQGDSLWVPPGESATTATLPEITSSRYGLSAALKICDNLGLSPARYILSGAGSTSFPEIRPLHTTEASTYALLVDRLVAEESIRGTRRSRIPSQWYQCPRRPVVDAFTESEAETYELDGLQAWVEVCAAPWYLAASFGSPSTMSQPPLQTDSSTFPAPSHRLSADAATFTPTVTHTAVAGPPAGVARAPEDPMAMFTPDDRSYQTAIKNESSLLKDIYKLVDDLPEFPGDHYTKGRAMDDLEEFSVAVNALLEHMMVIAALTTPSFRREAQGRNQLSVSTLLWMIKTAKLAKAQKLYVEEMAPGGSEGEAWKARYAAVPRFMGDLALSVDITTDALKRLKSELLSTRQRSEENTGAFYTRITTRTATVNFVADVVTGCGKVTKLELLELFWGGLRHSVQVGSKLVDVGLDTSHPEQWEDEQRRLGRSDTSATLKVRSVATEIETAKVMEDAVLQDTIARKVALEMGHRQRQAPPRSTPAGQPRWTPRRPALAALTWEPGTAGGDSATAAPVTVSTAATQGSRPAPAVRERPCFACGSLEHLVANCTDEKKLAIWKANAPARLARRPGQVAACVEVIEERVEEDSPNPEELETMEEILALADADVDLYGDLCAMCDITSTEDPAFRSGEPTGAPGQEEYSNHSVIRKPANKKVASFFDFFTIFNT
ncbi:hypothetical protein CYMTET_8588 [Cymbomonas tetramitiformis]|uniref:CCHC-type domain-containing protein n=1 Tax=Cymbomonas tetramitiformis TaxID=36881 RepID=A0AAE0LFV2_9CHLO|nr:hypothetical protein CYMTET_8588 [Cymbomonas tetramitiformis]